MEGTNAFLVQNSANLGVTMNAGTGASIYTDNLAIAPDGTMTAQRVQLSAPAAADVAGSRNTNMADQRRVSVWMRSRQGPVTVAFGGAAAPTNVMAVTTTWARFSIVASSLRLYINGDGTTSNSVDLEVWAANTPLDSLNQRLSSTVDVVGSSTRARDTLAGLISAMNLPATGFTVSGRSMLLQINPPDGPQLIQIDDGTNNNRFVLYNGAATATLRLLRTLAGASVNATASGTFSAGVPFGYAIALDLVAGAASYCIEGGTVQSVIGGPTSGITTLRIGDNAGGSGSLYGEISANVLPYIVANANLPALAAAA